MRIQYEYTQTQCDEDARDVNNISVPEITFSACHYLNGLNKIRVLTSYIAEIIRFRGGLWELYHRVVLTKILQNFTIDVKLINAYCTGD